MSKKNLIIILLMALAIGGFIWADDEKKKRKTAEKKLQKKDQDYLQLLSKYLDTQKSLPEEIKTQLIHLRQEYIGIQDDIALELKGIVELIESGKEEIAIEKLAKVIEHLLKEKFVAEGKAKDKRTCPKLFKLLDEALKLNWINQHEYNVAFILRELRNDEAHELAVKFPENWRYISFLGGIELIYNLKGIKRNQP